MIKKLQILATIGPASLDKIVIQRLDALGVDLFRINLSHVDINVAEKMMQTIGQYTKKPICIDTEGAQIRNRSVKGGEIYLKEGDIVDIVSENIICDEHTISLTPGFVVEKIEIGSLINVDFNSLFLQVIEKNGGSLKARVLCGGIVGSNKAVTVDQDIMLPVLSKKDKEVMTLSKKYGITNFALSFASSKEAVSEMRELVGAQARIIAKIESRQGVKNVDAIVTLADALLIDRGDLSREVPIEKIPFLQKLLIQRANSAGKPIYVATNLLESMTQKRKPTRAEVNDVINTLLDGADGLVLAAETAIGQHPVDCAAVVVSLINEFESSNRKVSFGKLLDDHSRFLIKPHGGILTYRIAQECDKTLLNQYPRLIVDEKILMDAEQIALGSFSPLQGFMNREELTSVLHDYKLSNGVAWPLPILLQVSKEEATKFHEGTIVSLALQSSQDIVATIEIEEIYPYDLTELSQMMFGTQDKAHPGVAALFGKDNYFIGGKVELIKRLPRMNKQYEFTPLQTRALFEHKGWSRVVGFHTRNVVHRAHETLQILALERTSCDGLFVHPVIGIKKKGDFVSHAIIQSYEKLLNTYYPKEKVLIGAFSTYSRYAGPREAVFTALCRKNFGCTHFIMGRDHTGVGNFYGTHASQELFKSMGDLGITPVFFDTISYCQQCNRYVEKCNHDEKNMRLISGSEAREMLKSGKELPDWFMRKEISTFLLEEIERGEEIFVA